MKYLKKFNEELKSKTYLNAARKLNKLGDKDRSKKLTEYGLKIEEKENIEKWKKTIDEYSEFGTYKIAIRPPTYEILMDSFIGDFHLAVIFDDCSFMDGLGEDSPNIIFYIGIIPKDDETLNMCLKNMPENDFDNGFFWGMFLSIKFDKSSNTIKFTELKLEPYDRGSYGDISIGDRQSAGRFKNLIKNIISNKDLNYPSSMNNTDYMYETLSNTILSEAGLSLDYGLSLDDISEFIGTISPNTLYKTL